MRMRFTCTTVLAGGEISQSIGMICRSLIFPRSHIMSCLFSSRAGRDGVLRTPTSPARRSYGSLFSSRRATGVCKSYILPWFLHIFIVYIAPVARLQFIRTRGTWLGYAAPYSSREASHFRGVFQVRGFFEVFQKRSKIGSARMHFFR